MNVIKELAWCVVTIVTICLITVALLLLGAAIPEKTEQKYEKVINCLPTGKGFYACKTEWI